LLETIWPDLVYALLAANVTVKLPCDEPTRAAPASRAQASQVQFPPSAHPTLSTHVFSATPEAYTTEHLSLALAVHTVPSLAAAIEHINKHWLAPY
jgi:glutamate-5-semialdehyde dehydrogenase